MSQRKPKDETASLSAALSALGSLSDDRIKQVVDQATDAGLPGIQYLMQEAIVSPADLEVVDMLMRANQAIPGYELLGILGRGGMGVVYRALQTNLNREVAIKTVQSALVESDSALRRFEREALTIAQLSHPNIVQAFDFGSHKGRLFLAMEYIRGEDLGSRIDNNGPVPESILWSIVHQVAAGLLHASLAGVVHRDVKPANILLLVPPAGFRFQAGVPMAKISDFGLSLLNPQDGGQSRLTTLDATIGSPYYMAPEQFDGGEPSLSTDMYALGATVFHALRGKPPWHDLPLRRLVACKASMADFESELAQLEAAATPLVSKMMHPDASQRFTSYEQLLEEVELQIERQPFAEGEPARHPFVLSCKPAPHASIDSPPASIAQLNTKADRESRTTKMRADEAGAAGATQLGRVRIPRSLRPFALVAATIAVTVAILPWFRPPVEMERSDSSHALIDFQDISSTRKEWRVESGRLVAVSIPCRLEFAIPRELLYYAVDIEVHDLSGAMLKIQLADDEQPMFSINGGDSPPTVTAADHPPKEHSLSEHPTFTIERRAVVWRLLVDGSPVEHIDLEGDPGSKFALSVTGRQSESGPSFKAINAVELRVKAGRALR